MTEANLRSSGTVDRLNQLFGNYRAEWLREKIFDVFTQPSYFPNLETKSPCVLIGGRGTGKTTVLRSLSYEGQFALSKKDVNAISAWEYYGFYYRVDTNRVTAFQGTELEEAVWTKLFAHYINLLLCGQGLKFLNWYALHRPEAPVLPPDACRRVAISLCLDSAESVQELLLQLDYARLRFEAFLNNITSTNLPNISLQGAPIDELLSHVVALPHFKRKHFFFLIDEFENFTDPQQIVMNTLIKHSGETHSFKIGVKELGWRHRSTLNPNEQLNSPADYVRISIAEQLAGPKFQEFALQIFNQRLAQLDEAQGESIRIDSLLGALTLDEEAKLLGLDRQNLLAMIARSEPSVKAPDEMSTLELYFAVQWSHWKNRDVAEVLAERNENPKKWNDRFANYQHALLYTIRRGKSGIRKYYAGWRTFVHLAGSNIRYLFELVDRTLVLHLEKGFELGQPVSPENQTVAAQNVGMKNVSELEGLSVQGAQLTKLVLGLGRVFQVLAYHPEGHSPEQNQFTIAEKGNPNEELSELLRAAVMHLALVRSSGTKLADEGDFKAYDYSLHPIFAPYFVFSYRKKRKLSLSPQMLVGLIHNSKPTISEILSGNATDDDAPLPDQLRLFEGYYGSPS